MKSKHLLISGLLVAFLIGSSFSISGPSIWPKTIPPGTTIVLNNCYSLPEASYQVWCNEHQRWEAVLNLYRQYKVVFYGSRYSDGQGVSDPNCPIIETTYNDDGETAQLANFYYLEGHITVYSRSDSSEPWTYAGYMFMSSSNCTMDLGKVTVFSVDCNYLQGDEIE